MYALYFLFFIQYKIQQNSEKALQTNAVIQSACHV